MFKREFIFKQWDLILAGVVATILSLAFPLMLLQIYDRVIPNHAMGTAIYIGTIVTIAILVELILKSTKNYVSCKIFQHMNETLEYNYLVRMMNQHLSLATQQHVSEEYINYQKMSKLGLYYSGYFSLLICDLIFSSILILIIGFIVGIMVLVPIVLLFLSLVWVAFYLHNNIPILVRQYIHGYKLEKLWFLWAIDYYQFVSKKIAKKTLLINQYNNIKKTSYFSLHWKILSVSENFIQTISQYILIIFVIVGCYLVSKNHLTMGALAASTLILSRCMQSIKNSPSLFDKLLSAKYLEKVTNAKKLIEYKNNTVTLELAKKNINLIPNITFQDVYYAMPNTKEIILEKVNLQIEKGITGIVGQCRQKKNLMLLLCSHLVKPQKGEIFYGKLNAHDIPSSAIGEEILYIAEDFQYFTGTILENITQHDTSYASKAYECSKKLGMAEEIIKLKYGFDTKIDQLKGEDLSRGFLKKLLFVSIAITKPKILILDEVTASLDSGGDVILQKLFNLIKEDTLVLISTLRPSILRCCDRLLNIDKWEMSSRG